MVEVWLYLISLGTEREICMNCFDETSVKNKYSLVLKVLICLYVILRTIGILLRQTAASHIVEMLDVVIYIDILFIIIILVLKVIQDVHFKTGVEENKEIDLKNTDDNSL